MKNKPNQNIVDFNDVQTICKEKDCLKVTMDEHLTESIMHRHNSTDCKTHAFCKVSKIK